MKDIQELLQERIAQMMAANPSRINFYEKYQEIIHNYNAEQNRASIEKTFEDLIHLTEELSEEEKRYLREGFEMMNSFLCTTYCLKTICQKKISKS